MERRLNRRILSIALKRAQADLSSDQLPHDVRAATLRFAEAVIRLRAEIEVSTQIEEVRQPELFNAEL